jgi:hypothetical protein
MLTLVNYSFNPMAEVAPDDRAKLKKTNKKENPAQIFAEDMSEEMSKEAIKVARDGFALTITSG